MSENWLYVSVDEGASSGRIWIFLIAVCLYVWLGGWRSLVSLDEGSYCLEMLNKCMLLLSALGLGEGCKWGNVQPVSTQVQTVWYCCTGMTIHLVWFGSLLAMQWEKFHYRVWFWWFHQLRTMVYAICCCQLVNWIRNTTPESSLILIQCNASGRLPPASGWYHQATAYSMLAMKPCQW